MADSGGYDDSPAKRRNNQDTAPKRRERSAIWKHFVKTSSSLAQCKTCGATIKTPTGTTSPLVNHLKQHPTAMEYRMTATGAPEKDQSMIFDFVHRTNPLSEKKTQALNAKVAAMVALDLQPYSFVEDRGFKELMAEAVPNYRLPSRTTLSRTLVPRLFDDTRKKVKDELSSAFEGGTSAVTFTSDMWTSRANESYVSFTCHLLTPSFRMKRFTLNIRHMELVSHSAENIARMLVEMCAEWEIPDGCRKYIVTDNGRNIHAAVRRLLWTERACFAHTLQLAIYDAISNTPSIDRLCKKARHIVGHYKHSSSAQKRLDEYQKKMGKDPLRLVQDVDTRWNSQYLMLSRLLDLKEAVSVELATSSSSIDGLCSAEWKEALEYLDALKPLYDATDVALCPAVEVVQPAAKVQEPQQCVQPSSDVWSAFDNLANSQVASTPLSTSEWEIKAYSEEALLKKDSDPCDWWRTVGTFRYPSGKALPQVLAHTSHFISKRACLFSGRGGCLCSEGAPPA
ncbi:hypothetical protein HPB51_002839 [Rhipicephalus microplus]|uniref:BED-type domain-containing protein n=1 Tax=Rhipicephalus microplus TaxID=6941 RepID=A0A9J6EWW7_RHIMP|nr:hypothetical protein HPB51_002839 [Rhipicephalus microplus]